MLENVFLSSMLMNGIQAQEDAESILVAKNDDCFINAGTIQGGWFCA
jgi:hypothetical protein